MKLLLDFLPILLFFVTFKGAERHAASAAEFATRHFGWMVSGGAVGPKEAPVMLATLVVIAATLAQVAWLKIRRDKVPVMLWISLALIVVLGGLTIWLRSETFIKWKPTGLYWAMALAFLLAPWLARRNLLKAMLGEQVALPDAAWARLNAAWVAFFVLMGILNLVVAYRFSTDVWVDFKLFGSVGLMLLFTLGQGVYIQRHLLPAASERSPAERPRR